MEFSLNKSKRIILLLFAITLFSTHSSKAQNVSAKDDNILSLSIECPNNSQCVYSGQKFFPITTKIKNNSNQNLEIPLEAIKSFLTTSYLINIKTGKTVGNIISPGMPIPELLEQLTLIPAHSEIIMTGNYTKNYLNNIFNKEKTNTIALYKTINTYVYFEDLKKPIGYYKDDKFEPKQFILKAQKVITKQ